MNLNLLCFFIELLQHYESTWIKYDYLVNIYSNKKMINYFVNK